MDVVGFAIWKFRYIEGYLQGMHAVDLTTTKYVAPGRNIATAYIHYDYKKETAEIEICGVGRYIECSFSTLVQTLKDENMYSVLPENCKHRLAGPQRED